MLNWRREKRQMHRDVHDTMGVPALLLRSLDDDVQHEITIRGPHNKRQVRSGDLAGGGEGWAEREDTAPRICFEVAQLPFPLARNHIVSVEQGEAYRIDSVAEPKLGWVWANVIPTSAADAAGLPLPDNADG